MARRVTVSATIDGVDDETFGSNEYGHAEFTRETILSDSQPQNVMKMQCKWGGECRVEFELTGQQLDSGNVRVSGIARLFEGTSEDTGDLDGESQFVFEVPKGQSVTNDQRVDNTDEGGDYATIKMTVNNALVE